jgi:hypothetical protein
VSKAKPGLPSIFANLSYAHDRDVIARSILQQHELKRLTSAGLAFHENARWALAIFSHRAVELNFVFADFANPALGW